MGDSGNYRKALPERHPVMGCRCPEGAVYTMVPTAIIRWLPPVHDCAYIEQRNRQLGLERRRVTP